MLMDVMDGLSVSLVDDAVEVGTIREKLAKVDAEYTACFSLSSRCTRRDISIIT